MADGRVPEYWQEPNTGIWIPDSKSVATVIDEKGDRVSEALYSGNLPDWSAISKYRDYHSFLEAIRINWVFSCVSVISYNFASTHYALWKDEDEQDDPGNPLLQLLARPNAYQTGFQWRELLAMFLELTGNAYITLEEVDGNGQPRQLYLPDPSRMRIKPGPDGVQGYVYDPSGATPFQGSNYLSRLIPYAPEEVIHVKMANPLDAFYGFGNIEASTVLMDIVSSMQQQEFSYWSSGGRILGALETDKKLSDPDFIKLKRDWQSASADRKQRARTVILEQGLKYTPIAEGFRSLDVVNIDKSKRDAVLAVFGVPLPKLGIMEMAQYKMDEADAFFWQETMSPKFTRFEDAIQPLVDLYDPDARLEFERRTFEDDQYKIQNASQLVAAGLITVDEGRVLVGMDPLPNRAGEVLMMNSVMTPVPIDQFSDYSDALTTQTIEPPETLDENAGSSNGDLSLDGDGNSVDGSASDGTDSNVIALADHVPGMKAWHKRREQGSKEIRRSKIRRANKATTPMERLHIYHVKKLGTPTKLPNPPNKANPSYPLIGEAIRRHRDRTVKPVVEETAQALRKAFVQQRKTVISALGRIGRAETPESREMALRSVWNPEPLRKALMPLYATTIPAGAQMALRVLPQKARVKAHRVKNTKDAEVQMDDQFAGIPQVVRDQFPRLGEKINRSWQSIDDTTFNNIQQQLEVGMERGYTSLQIANGVEKENYKGITGVFDDAETWRADMIARTEAMHSYNWGTWQSSTDAGVRQMQAMDGTEFDEACMARNDQIYDMDPVSAEPIDNGYGTEDHPNGTLCWVPLPESIDVQSMME